MSSFIYISNCCNAAGIKEACVKPAKDDKNGYSTLGTWRCSVCNKKAKMRRIKKEQE